MKNLFFASLAVLLVSCTKTDVDHRASSSSGFQDFVISMGSHSANLAKPQSFEGNEISYMVVFDSSAIYQTQEKTNQGDINKLFGFSDGPSTHHENSARFGWRWSEGGLRLFAYIYNEGERVFQELATVSLGEPVTCAILVRPGEYGFIVNGKETIMKRHSVERLAQGYLLWPYFGGDELAPHDIVIKMKRIR